jgi:CHASE2 domain-containing sensor protein
MAGVLLHAQMVSQLLDAAMEGRSLFWFWSEWVEALWIATWAAIGGALAWYVRQPMVLALSGALLLLSLAAIGFGLFLQHGWIPLAAPAFAATATGGLVIAYRAYWSQQSDKFGL